VSIVFFTDTWRPRSFYARIAANRRAGLHTLCLLHIKVREPSLESLARGRKARARPSCGRRVAERGRVASGHVWAESPDAKP